MAINRIVYLSSFDFTQRLSLSTAVEPESKPTRESSLQATSKVHKEQAIKEKLKSAIKEKTQS
jgi:hypothetical protein